MRNNTLIWSKNITDEDKTEVEKFKNITLKSEKNVKHMRHNNW